MSILLDLVYCLTLLPHYLYHRLFTGKYGAKAGEKLGLPSGLRQPVTGKCLWVHAVSVGEALAAVPLVNEFKDSHPDWQIKVSTTTATGREIAEQKFGKGNVFYFPLDISLAVKRTWKIINPRLVVLMELEIWPNFLTLAKSLKVPVAVSNVRITDKSARNFQRLGQLGTKILNQVSLWAAQNQHYGEVLQKLGVNPSHIEVVGSLKYDGLDFSAKPKETKHLLQELGGGRILVAGSTHPGEDEIILACFIKLRREFGKELRLCLVPRHPERCPEVEKIAPREMKLWRRSRGTAPTGTDIVLVDLIGELSNLYRAAEIVFIGGTFSQEVGGHNMLEPAAFAKPVVYGPYVHNFTEPAALLEKAGGALRLTEASTDALFSVWNKMLREPQSAKEMGKLAQKAVQGMQGAKNKTVALLNKLLHNHYSC